MNIEQQERFGTEQEQSEGKDGRLLEIYKLHVQSMGNAIQRQLTINRFYQIMLFGVCILLGRFFEREEGAVWMGLTKEISVERALMGISLLGNLLSWRWFISVDSYLQEKFLRHEGLMELEVQLEYQFLIRQQELMDEKTQYSTYKKLSTSTRELYLPFVCAVFFGTLFCATVVRMPNRLYLSFLIFPIITLIDMWTADWKFKPLSKPRL